MTCPEDQHLGESHESEPYVNLFRGISPEVHLETLNREKAKSFDEGWVAGVDHGVRMSREETRAIRRQHIDRLSETYRHWRRSFIKSALLSVAVVAVPIIAIWLPRGV